MTRRETAMGPGAEFDAIREMLRRWGPRAQGIGDDAALLDVPPGHHLAVSTDSTVENVHFRRGWLTPHEIAYRATVAALSDLAAMAATPMGLVSALAIPRDWRGQLSEIAEGIGEAAEEFATPIVGGNVTGGALLTITITVLGSVEHALPRSGVQPGDTLYVTGQLGASGAALRALEKGDNPAPEHRSRFARPTPRIKEARWLAANGARAAIDVSDGLLSELTHLAAASGVRIQLVAEGVPLAEGVSVSDALQSGEEYELLVAGPALDSARFARELGVPLAAVGIARAPAAGEGPGVDNARAGKDARVAPARGHDHFSS